MPDLATRGAISTPIYKHVQQPPHGQHALVELLGILAFLVTLVAWLYKQRRTGFAATSALRKRRRMAIY